MTLGIWYLCAGFFGASIGSFITLLVYRLHEGGSIVVGRSMCTSCKQSLRWFELIPLISFLLLRGKCSRCKAKISVRYFLIELVTTTLYVFVWHLFVTNPFASSIMLIRDWLIIFVLVFVFVYDALYMEVHPVVTIGGGLLVGALSIVHVPSLWQTLLFGAVLGVGWFLFQYVISKGRWIGGGDIMIGFFMGLALGFWNTVVALGIAYIIGASYGVALLATQKKNRKDQIAFGTFLAIGSLIAFIWGTDIIGWYQSLLV